MDSITGLLTGLGAVATLTSLTWIAYVEAIRRGPRGWHLLVGVGALVLGAAALVAGAAVGTGGGSDGFVGVGQPRSTATPRPTPSPTPTVEPVAAYRAGMLAVAGRAGEAFTTLFQLLQSPSANNPIWLSQVRQTAGEFARERARAAALEPPEGWADTQVRLIEALDPVVTAARQLVSSFDAQRAGNPDVAAALIEKAVADLSSSAANLQTVAAELAARDTTAAGTAVPEAP